MGLRKNIRIIFCIAALGVPQVLVAAPEAAPATDNLAPKKFIPLAGARDARLQQPSTARVAKPRSDREAMASGFMRLDRNLLRPNPPSNVRIIAPTAPVAPTVTAPVAPTVTASLAAPETALPIPPADNEDPEASASGDNPVLSIFGGSTDEKLGSFADVLRGKLGKSSAGREGYRWPIPLSVEQRLTSGFGMRNDPFDGNREFHGGIDIAAAVGTPVLASADGGVAKVTTDRRYGKYITLLHADGTETLYGHLSAQSVREGQLVTAGQTIGAVGATGRATGAHLDFRIKRNGVKFDPMRVLDVPSQLARTTPRPAVKVATVEPPPAPDSKRYKIITVR